MNTDNPFQISTENYEPLEYHISLDFPHPDELENADEQDLKQILVKGFVKITLSIKNPIQSFQLHGLRLKIREVIAESFENPNLTTKIKNDQITYDMTLETFTFHFDQSDGNFQQLFSSLPTKINVNIWYSPVIDNFGDRNGLFARIYFSQSLNRNVFQYASQLEPCNPRQVFPCFDQPSTKSKFNIEITSASFQQAISNMPVVSVTEEQVTIRSFHAQSEITVIDLPTDDLPAVTDLAIVTEAVVTKKRTVFAKTPLMSTYLLGFIVGEFDYVEKMVELDYFPTITSKQTPLGNNLDTLSPVYSGTPDSPAQKILVPNRIYTPKNRKDEGLFALYFLERVLTFLNGTFRITNPVPKLDIVPIDRLPVLGMENWGIMSFNQDFLLVNQSTPFSRIQRISRLICHETLHQWFGDLTTMKWWKYLWLKEGMARYLEYVIINEFYPNWNYWTHYLKDILEPAMSMDERRSSHPVEANVLSPHEIFDIFDLISYAKGSGVARMISSFLGMENFWKSLSQFQKKFQFGTAVSDDLCACWQDFFPENSPKIQLRGVLSDWVEWSGHPVLIVTPGATPGSFHLQQQLFFVNNLTPSHRMKLVDAEKDLTSEVAIPVQVKVGGKNSKLIKFVMESSEMEFTVPDFDPTDSETWICFNWNFIGFYRTRYDRSLLDNLGKAIQRGEIPMQDVFGLTMDVFAMFENQGSNTAIDAATLLSFLRNLSGISEPFLIEFLLPKLNSLITKSSDSSWNLPLKQFVTKLLQKTVEAAGLWKSTNGHNENLAEYISDLIRDLNLPTQEHHFNEFRWPLLKLLYFCGGIRSDWKHAAEILELFREFQELRGALNFSPVAIHHHLLSLPSVVDCVLCLGVALGDDSHFAYVRELGENSPKGSNLRRSCITALLFTQNPSLLEEATKLVWQVADKTLLEHLIESNIFAHNNPAKTLLWKKAIQSISACSDMQDTECVSKIRIQVEKFYVLCQALLQPSMNISLQNTLAELDELTKEENYQTGLQFVVDVLHRMKVLVMQNTEWANQHQASFMEFFAS